MFLRMRVTRWMSSTNNSLKRRCEMYSLLPLVFVQTKRVASLSCKCHPHVEGQRLLACSDRSRYDEVAMVQ